MSFPHGLAHWFFRASVQRWLRLAWLAVVLACAASVIAILAGGRQFDTSIIALLPEEQQSPAERLAKERLSEAAASRLAFVLAHSDPKTGSAAAERFAQALRRSELFSQVQGRVDDDRRQQWTQSLWPYRYNYLTPAAAEQLQNLPVNEQHPLLHTALARLYSPLAATVAPNLVDDPLQLFYQWQLSALPQSGFNVQNGWLVRSDGELTYYLVTATLQQSAYDMAYQQQVSQVVNDAENLLPPNADLLRSGLLFHAHYGAQQAQREISTIGLGSLAGITLLLVYVLRRLRPVVLAFLPLATGLLFSFALSLLIFERLHLVTLAFGAGLVGVAIDYSLHYLCADFEFAKRAPPLTTLRRIFPAIALGLISSGLAYAAQAAAPFPGLRQMALFSVLGLLGAWLTVVLWLPYLRRRDGRAASKRERREMELGLVSTLQLLLRRWPSINTRGVQLLLLLVVALSVWQIAQLEYDDSIRRLQTSPPALLDEDARVQTLLGGFSGGQYYLVSAEDRQTLLQRQQALQGELNRMIEAGEIHDYQSLARWVPSRERQQRNRELRANKVYAEQGLLPLLANQLEAPQLIKRARRQFADNDAIMTLDTWLSQPTSRELDYLWLGETDNQFHALVTLAGIESPRIVEELATLSQVDAGIRFIDNVGTISRVLRHHREQLQRWLVVAYAVVLVLLIARYGKQAWRLVAAPAVASIATLALLSASGAVVNIFNLLALLLVLGIGLDASIFLRESGRSAYTWVAVSLAAATTLMAFGLLSLSETPVLHQFGITVLVGIIGVWLLAPCFVVADASPRQPTNNQEQQIAR